MPVHNEVRSALLHAKVVDGSAWPSIQGVLDALAAGNVTLKATSAFLTLTGDRTGLPTMAPWAGGGEDKPDLVLSFGGDGTVLDTASLPGLEQVPVLGINTGRLGFLSHLTAEGAADAMQGILAGEYIVDSREMLEVSCQGMDLEGGGLALNEVTIHRRDVASMIRISVQRNGSFVNRYWADGLIVSTATGSTAYSLSCGGPIVHPASQAIVLNPIAPHNLNDRPLVIPSEGVLDIQAEGRDDHLVLTLDTRSHILPAPARFTVRKADRPFLLVGLPGSEFIETVRRKLHLGLDGREGPSNAPTQENRPGDR